MRYCQNRWTTAANQERDLHILYTVIELYSKKHNHPFQVYFFLWNQCTPLVKTEKSIKTDVTNVSGTMT